MTHKQRNVLLLIVGSLLLGIVTDTLIRQELFGFNFLIWTNIWCVLLVGSAYRNKRAHLTLLVHLTIALLSAYMVYIRSEPIVQIWSVGITLALIANSFMRVHIPQFNTLSYTSKFVEWLSNWLGASYKMLEKFGGSKKTKSSRKISAGVILAIPLAFIFIGLFSSSDEIFRSSFSWIGDIAQSIGNFLGQFDMAKLLSVSFWIVVTFSWLCVLILTRKSPTDIQLSLPKILSAKDIRIIYLTIIPIFLMYSFIQLRYLFAGADLPDGMTYADYARRGYGELLLTTVIAAAVVYYTTVMTKSGELKARAYSYILLALNLFVVASAWKRLSLYESAYGWTMTRFVARLGLICLFLGCIALMIWIRGIVSKNQLIALNGYILVSVLMLASILNPIGLVTKNNLLGRASREVELDVLHMLRQSPDSYPAICKNAEVLRYSYPNEYFALKTRTLIADKNNPAGSDAYDMSNFHAKEKNSGLSRHYVYTKSFVDKYHNCLP